MSWTNRTMDSSQAGSVILRSTSAVSLNERFSQMLTDQLTWSRIVTFDPIMLEQRRECGTPPVVLLSKKETSSPRDLQTRDPSASVKQRLGRRSVWTRLGWQQTARPLSASRSAGFTSTCRRRGNHWSRLGQHRLLMRGNVQKLTAGQTHLNMHLQRGGAITAGGRGQHKSYITTKEQLDAQLDEYMSMAGQTDLLWD